MEIVFLEQAEKDRNIEKDREQGYNEQDNSPAERYCCTSVHRNRKPEPLKYELAGYWSRRINAEHRIIYSVHDDIVTVYVLSMRYHYVK